MDGHASRPHLTHITDGYSRILFISEYTCAVLDYLQAELLHNSVTHQLRRDITPEVRQAYLDELKQTPDVEHRYPDGLVYLNARDGRKVVYYNATMMWHSATESLIVDGEASPEDDAIARAGGPQFRDPRDANTMREFLAQREQQRIEELERLIAETRQQLAQFKTVEVVPVDRGHLSNVSAIVRPVQPTLPGMDGEDKLDRVLAELEDLKRRLAGRGRKTERKPRQTFDEKKRTFMAKANAAYQRFLELPAYKRRPADLRPYLADQLGYSEKTVYRHTRDYKLRLEDLPWGMA